MLTLDELLAGIKTIIEMIIAKLAEIFQAKLDENETTGE